MTHSNLILKVGFLNNMSNKNSFDAGFKNPSPNPFMPSSEEEKPHLYSGTNQKISRNPLHNRDVASDPPQARSLPPRSPPPSPQGRVPPSQLVSLGAHQSRTSLDSDASSYINDESDDEESIRRRVKRTQLVNFWASLSALFLSTLLLAYSFVFLHSRPLSSALQLCCVLGFLTGFASFIVQISHCLPEVSPKFLHFRIQTNLTLNLGITFFCSLAFMHHDYILGTLFLLHLIPFSLFLTATTRREMTPSKIY